MRISRAWMLWYIIQMQANLPKRAIPPSLPRTKERVPSGSTTGARTQQPNPEKRSSRVVNTPVTPTALATFIVPKKLGRPRLPTPERQPREEQRKAELVLKRQQVREAEERVDAEEKSVRAVPCATGGRRSGGEEGESVDQCHASLRDSASP